MKSYDGHFEQLHYASKLSAKTDWGFDLTRDPYPPQSHAGPSVLASKIGSARIQMHLEEGDDEKALRDINSVMVLARRMAATPDTLSVAVEINMEKRITETLCRNFHLFSDASLEDLKQIFASQPKRVTTLDTIPLERFQMSGWMEQRVLEIQRTAETDEEANGETRAFLREQFESACGCSDEVQGILDQIDDANDALTMIRDSYRYFEDIEKMLDQPLKDAVAAIEEFNQSDDPIGNYENPILTQWAPPFYGAIRHEARVTVMAAQLMAAIEHRLGGAEAFKRVNDPMGDGPFELGESALKGKQIGFTVISKIDHPDTRERFFPMPSGLRSTELLRSVPPRVTP